MPDEQKSPKDPEKQNQDDVSDANETETDDDKKTKVKKNKIAGKTIVLFIVLPVLLIIAIALILFFFIFSDEALEEKSTSKEKTPLIKETLFFELPELVANLRQTGKQKTQYLKIIIKLEYSQEKTVERIQALMPKIIDFINIYARELRINDLEGTAGAIILKEAILKRINFIIEPQKIDSVLFQQIIIQ